MRGFALTCILTAAALARTAPAAASVPDSLAALEGRGPGAVGSVGAELGAAGAALRFSAPAGGAAELVLYLGAAPRADGLELRSGAALASLLGVRGEVRLSDLPSRAAREELRPVEAAPEAVPEPGVPALTALGLGLLARLARWRAPCHPAGRWSGPPAG